MISCLAVDDILTPQTLNLLGPSHIIFPDCINELLSLPAGRASAVPLFIRKRFCFDVTGDVSYVRTLR